MTSGTRDGNASIGGGGLREGFGLRSCNGTSKKASGQGQGVTECDYLRGAPAEVIVSMRPRVHSSKFERLVRAGTLRKCAAPTRNPPFSCGSAEARHPGRQFLSAAFPCKTGI